MKSLLIATVAIVMLASVAHAAASDKEFESTANQYIDKLLEMNPEYATTLGDHRFDGRLTDRSAAAIAEQARVAQSYLDRLAAIDAKSLSEVNAIDYAILKLNLERAVFEANELKEHEWNPLFYNMGNAIYALIARDFAPLDDRLRSVKSRLEEIPAVVAAAQANLKTPPRVHTETAILQNQGNIGMIRDELSQFVEGSSVAAELAPVREAAAKALEAYGEWLEKDLLPRSNGDVRIGDAMWRKKLRFSLDSDLSKEEIYARAAADLKATQKTMYETALPLYKKYFPEDTDPARLGDVKLVNKAVLDKLAEDRPNNDTIVPKAKQTLADAIAFTREHKLVTVPTEPVKIIVMPEFQRGVAVAYCESPGPMEPQGETFYSISPTPQDWTPERTTSFFKEYNDYMLNDLTVHEAVPGHYLQGAHSNKFKAPTMVRAVFYSGSFVEGWAVYSEKVMADAGFGGPAVKMQQLKMRLRVIINAIIDQKIHTEGMTEDEAMALMKNEGFQEDGEAAGKWRRACLSSTQLSTYFVGSAEVEDIRRAYEAKNKSVDLQKMHDNMLSFGSPSAKYIARMMKL
ncbi:MAG: DUF885 domain-containing protein [Candidatus Krumholzibacteria bacterium]|nr:DUF885 domain-containing protein [Candidatus Krumholzibacteria bacterium]MDH4336018.1 DUF885 domain-containing protein [Candidatus Krumholzibacteria bacterium]MDH5268406.1 DUF885 domain-containing protein [Candidatus Krumholzibacteria bacterium]